MATGGPPSDGGDDMLGVYLEQAECLIAKCRELQQIKGIHKLEKNGKAELKYLLSLKKKSGSIHESQLKSSNLCHFAGILHALQVIPNVTRVMKKFNIDQRTESLNVDVVAGQGLTWVKVIARKAQSLHLIWAGQGQFGERDLVRQAEDYIACSKQHPVNYVTPKVNFAFYNQVTKQMADALEERGVKVWGQRVDVSPEIEVKVQSIQAMFVDSDDSSSEDYLSEEDYSSEENEDEGQSSPEEEVTTDTADSFKNLNIAEEKLLSDTKPSLSETTQSAKNYSGLKVCDTFENLTDEKQQNRLSELETSSSLRGCQCHQPSNDYGKETSFCQNSTGSFINDPSSFKNDASSFKNDANSFKNGASSFKNDASSFKDKGHECRQDDSMSSLECIKYNLSSGVTSDRCSQLAGSEKLKSVITNNEQSLETSSQSSNHPSTDDQPFVSCLLTFLPNFEICEMIGTNQVSVGQSVSSERGRVNLDITTLITLVSSVCHGGCHFAFKEKILTLQAAEERNRPVLPSLHAFIKGKDLFVCQTALDDFKTILNTLGGTTEKQRSEELLKKVTVVPDNPSDRARDMPETGKIRQRSKVVFGTGDRLKAVTTSANVGFVRAAEHQGVYFAVHLHQSRALTEQKEKNATRIDGS